MNAMSKRLHGQTAAKCCTVDGRLMQGCKPECGMSNDKGRCPKHTRMSQCAPAKSPEMRNVMAAGFVAKSPAGVLTLHFLDMPQAIRQIQAAFPASFGGTQERGPSSGCSDS